MPRTLSERIVEQLQQRPGERLTARDLASAMVRADPAWAEEKWRRSRQELDFDGLVQQVVAEIGANLSQLRSRYRSVKTTEDRPRRYYWSEEPGDAVIEEDTETAQPLERATPDLGSEADLYRRLCAYLHGELGLHPKRIDERAASRSSAGTDRWLYPDIVALQALTEDLHRDLIEVVRALPSRRAELWSFEVKKRLARSNARQAFFQAVSNSSWANFGYLVGAEIEADGSLDELRMLSARHGIGLIRPDPSDPSESEILIPAREQPEVDWEGCNRLTVNSRDMQHFIELVHQFLASGRVPRGFDCP